MKRFAWVVAAAIFAGLGAGCASMNGKQAQVRDDVDYEKIYLVEQWAKRNGATVVWVSYPRRYDSNITRVQ